MDRFVDIKTAAAALYDLIAQARKGTGTVITVNGQPVARLSALETAPAHRAKEPRQGVTLAPEFEPGDARLARMARESQVPYRLRELPRH